MFEISKKRAGQLKRIAGIRIRKSILKETGLTRPLERVKRNVKS